jgi:hypothetical protein
MPQPRIIRQVIADQQAGLPAAAAKSQSTPILI